MRLQDDEFTRRPATGELQEAKIASEGPGVRWQAQMEEHLKMVRSAEHVVKVGSVRNLTPQAAALAQASATAALALAVANAGSDLELAISKLAEGMAEDMLAEGMP